MKSRIAIPLTGLIAIIGILFLSAFRKQTGTESPYPDEKVTYGSTGKQESSKGLLSLSTSFENDFYTNSQGIGHFYAEVNAQQYPINGNQVRLPLNLSVVIDRSGSMAGDKIRNARQAAKHIVDKMGPEDHLSIVIYDSQIDVLQPAVRVTNKQSIKNLIDRITDRGGTNLMGGALKGYEEVRKFYNPTYVNRVLLLSDGLANEGITNPTEIERLVRNKIKENGISISTFGVGNDYNEDLMTAMAENGSGNYYFISNPQDVAGIFQKELNGLMDVLAQRTELKITLPDEVNVEKVFGYRFEQIGRVLTIRFHDVMAGETKGVLVRYRVRNGVNLPLRFTSSLSFIEPETGRQKRMNQENRCEFTTDNYTYNRSFSEWVASQVTLYESNERLEMAMKEVDKGNYQEARKMVQENNAYIKQKSHLVSKSPELQKVESTNASYDSQIKDVEAMPADEIKYLQKATKSTNYQLRNKKR